MDLLADEVLTLVFYHLDINTLIHAYCCSKRYNRLLNDGSTLRLLSKEADIRVNSTTFAVYVKNYIDKYMPERSRSYPRGIMRKALVTDDVVAFYNLHGKVDVHCNIARFFTYGQCDKMLEYLAFGMSLSEEEVILGSQMLIKKLENAGLVPSARWLVKKDFKQPSHQFEMRYVVYHNLPICSEDKSGLRVLLDICRFEMLLWKGVSIDQLVNEYQQLDKDMKQEINLLLWAYDRIDVIRRLDINIFQQDLRYCGNDMLLYYYNKGDVTKEQLHEEVGNYSVCTRSLEVVKEGYNGIQIDNWLIIKTDAVGTGDCELLEWLHENSSRAEFFSDLDLTDANPMYRIREVNIKYRNKVITNRTMHSTSSYTTLIIGMCTSVFAVSLLVKLLGMHILVVTPAMLMLLALLVYVCYYY